jgi:hypothetical protein
MGIAAMQQKSLSLEGFSREPDEQCFEVSTEWATNVVPCFKVGRPPGDERAVGRVADQVLPAPSGTVCRRLAGPLDGNKNATLLRRRQVPAHFGASPSHAQFGAGSRCFANDPELQSTEEYLLLLTGNA